MRDHARSSRPLTIGDGFRIGFGIAFWMAAFSVMVWVFLTICGVALMAALNV
jgi:hypothetical protein